MDAVLADTGPLVAVLDADDDAHDHCVRVLPEIGRLTTIWPVVTEAVYLLGRSWSSQAKLLEWIEEGTLRLLPLAVEDVPRIKALMHKYCDLPMDFADAALVRVAERERIRRVFTLDRRGFERFRPLRIGRFELLP